MSFSKIKLPFSSIQRFEVHFYKADVKMSLEMHEAMVISWCERESRARHVNFMKYCHFFPFRFGHCLNWNHKTHLKIALQVKKKKKRKSTELDFVFQPSLFKQRLLIGELWGNSVNPRKVPCIADARALINNFLSPCKARKSSLSTCAEIYFMSR